jgi:hypothetical protein
LVMHDSTAHDQLISGLQPPRRVARREGCQLADCSAALLKKGPNKISAGKKCGRIYGDFVQKGP